MKKWKVTALLLLMTLSGSAQARSWTGTVNFLIQRHSDGLIWVKLNGTPSQGGCGTEPYWAIRDETSEAGKRQFAMLMLAYASGSTVTLMAEDNSCFRWDQTQDINEVRLVS